MKRVYLAGPDVFLANAKLHGEELKTLCLQHNLIGIFPLDVEVNAEPNNLGSAIFKSNVNLIKTCHGVLANMSPFRGPSMDVGTAWEVGYAIGLGLPVVGYTSDMRTFPDRVTEYRNNKSQTFMDPDMVEDFGLHDNLMLDCSMVSVEKNISTAAQKLKEHFNFLNQTINYL